MLNKVEKTCGDQKLKTIEIKLVENLWGTKALKNF